ncbi:35908_t:CDS:2 [Gigaspora margarita]|uniref:35908_t:CDS:1 n=1 Tax=Gigaspora margarita TaxID=4874 RepID=A0ABN7V9I7_GIGMA|nr:35908_t:CDS:2 [Gigaspora margarita]
MVFDENQNKIFFPFLLFLIEARNTIASQFPNLNSQEISNIILNLWDCLPENTKTEYKNKAVKNNKNIFNVPLQKKRKISDNLCSNPNSQYVHSLIRMLLSCNLPLSIVNNNEFRQFCSSLDSRFRLPNSDIVRNIIINTYNRTEKLIHNKIIETAEFLSITLDIWTHTYFGSQLSKSKLTNKNIISITTNNIDNIVKESLSQMQIEIIPCFANILQISIESVLSFANDIINKSKNLIKILSNNTNQQKLRDIQQQIDPNIKHPLDVVRVDKDWSLIYCAIHCLIILQPSIRYFSAENKKLKENMFSDDELDICRELDIILNLFHELTEMLKGSKYPALSFVTPAIENFKQCLDIYEPKNEVIRQIINNILDILTNNFGVPSTHGLYGSFFDPCFKKMLYIDRVLRYQIFDKLQEQFTELVKPETLDNLDKDSKIWTFFQIYFQENVQTEFDKYLKLSQLLVTKENNPLAWWRENKHLFPTMAKLAKKYLTIPAFSAPNGGLFSDIKNHSLDLDIDLVNQIIWLKHNLL